MDVKVDDSISYIDTFEALKWAYIQKYDYISEEEQLDLMNMTYSFIDNTINEVLLKNKTQEKEEYIRKLCKFTIKIILPKINKKIYEYNLKRSENTRGILDSKEMIKLNNWLDLEDNFYAIASMRSLYHLALYLERDDAESQKVWCYIIDDVMGGIFYAANQMILNNKYQNLIKQCPTGYGKSKSDCVIISYILGYDPNATIMKVVGNPKLVGEITQNITKMLLSPRFGKVFKEFGKCQGKENEMFTTIKQTDGTFKLKWSKQARSFLCVNKDTAIDGTRYDYQFYDDVTQSKDKENVTQHMKDRSNYTSQWKKRASSEFTTKRFFTGTAYHREDFLSYIKDYYSSKLPLVKELELSKFKWSKFTKVSSDRKTVYIIVPKLANLELGESKAYCTFPQRFSKKEALDMLHGNLGSKREFYAMEQQTPLPPEKLCFDWAYLNQYDRLPEDIVNRQSLSKIIIDPSRKGYDNFSALVFEKSSIENTSKWYFTSCFYEQVSSKVAIPEVADLIIDHKCTTIYAESNIDISDLLEVELHKKNYYDYEIITFYSYEKKEDKISRARDDIRDNILFPVQGMYHFESPMGRALTDIVNYSLEGKNKHDDSPDCCAMFTIQEQEEKSNTIDILPINFRF